MEKLNVFDFSNIFIGSYFTDDCGCAHCCREHTLIYLYSGELEITDGGKNVGIIVSSASSGISGVLADAVRLIPEGNFIEPSLWIRSSQTSNAASLISAWLNNINYSGLASAVSSITADHDSEIIASDGLVSVTGNFYSLSLYNLSGNKVIGASGSQISTSSVASGIYIAQASNGNKTVTRKISIR